MANKIFLIFFFFFTSAAANEAEQKEYELNKMLKEFSQQIDEEYALRVYSSNSFFHGDIDLISMIFHSRRRANIDEARALELEVLHRLLDSINNNKKIHPYLAEYPFSLKNVCVGIIFENIWYRDTNVAYLGRRMNDDDTHCDLIFDTKDPFADNYSKLLEEPYEEALIRNKDFPQGNLAQHQETELEKALDQVLTPMRKSLLYQKHKIECWAIGTKGDKKIEALEAFLVIRKRVTQEEARNLILAVTNTILQELNQREELRAFLMEYPIPSKRLKLSLNFVTNSYASYHDGSMDSVKLINDELNYYRQEIRKGNELLAVDLELPVYAHETYQEALNIVNQPVETKKNYFDFLFGWW